ncbi:YkgJ family cysteine cluster protein, partial [Acinetobacter baumannii]|nr:YkgJ family cysteine cluster protein [Acinetobacter baumannii]
IILDPLDIYRLTFGLQQKFEQLLADKLELNVVDGVILPNLKMAGENEQCSFLNDEGRCSIHSIRPGICRLFPLGRY